MMLRQVMLASVANNKNYNCIFIEIARDTQSRSEIGTSRSTAKDPFHSPKHARQLERFTIRDVDHFIDILDVYIRGHDLLADSLDEVWSRLHDLSSFFIGLENRAVRICADDPDGGILLF